MDSRSRARDEVQRVVQEAFEGGLAPHIAVGWSFGDVREVRLAGCERSHLFDLASLTKPLVTAWLVAKCVDRGWWTPETRITDVLPELVSHECDPRWQKVTIESLANHSGGLPAWCNVASWGDVMKSRFEREPGFSQVYSDLTFITLGVALERVTGERLDRLAQRWNFGNNHRLKFDPAHANDENTRRLWNTERRFPGHAGLFGTLDAVLDQAELLLGGGGLSFETRNWMWSRSRLLNGDYGTRTPGWDTPTPPVTSAGRYFSEHAVGHLGFTGTSIWIEPARRLAVVVLTDRVAMGEDKSKIQAFRPRAHDAVWQAVLGER